MRACWRAYGAQHREERRLMNRLYNLRPEVILRRKERYLTKKRKFTDQGEPMLAFVKQ